MTGAVTGAVTVTVTGAVTGAVPLIEVVMMCWHGVAGTHCTGKSACSCPIPCVVESAPRSFEPTKEEVVWMDTAGQT